MNAKPIIITIDGPTASGKGAVAQLLAQHLGFSYLDSGVLYRTIALLAIRSGLALNDNIGKDKENELVKLTQTLPITFSKNSILLDGQEISNELRTENVGNMASKIAVINPLRESLLKRQRDFACLPGLVADGRDMGTVVFPDALIKLFLTASSQIRAERRYKQLIEKNIPANMANLVADLNERDARDSHRELAPLKAAHGAYVLDSSQLTLDETVAETLKYYAKIMG